MAHACSANLRALRLSLTRIESLRNLGKHLPCWNCSRRCAAAKLMVKFPNPKLMLWLSVVFIAGCGDGISVQRGLPQKSVLMQTSGAAHNPVIFADVPDPAVIRVGDTYYMSSTTMYYNPGVPIMKSKDLVNWEMAGYAYTTLGDTDALNLDNGKSAYGKGSWASSLRYHDGSFYCSTFSFTTNK